VTFLRKNVIQVLELKIMNLKGSEKENENENETRNMNFRIL